MLSNSNFSLSHAKDKVLYRKVHGNNLRIEGVLRYLPGTEIVTIAISQISNSISISKIKKLQCSTNLLCGIMAFDDEAYLC